MMMERLFGVILLLIFLLLVGAVDNSTHQWSTRQAVEEFHDLLASPMSDERIVQVVSPEDALCYNETFLLLPDLNQPGGLLGVFSTSETLFCFMERGDCDFSGTAYETAAIENCAAANGRIVTGDLYVCGSEFGRSDNNSIRFANLPLCVDAGCPFDTTYQRILRTALDLGLGDSSREFEETLMGKCVPTSETMDMAAAQATSPEYTRGIELSVEDFADGIANGEFDVILDVRSWPEWNLGRIEGATLANNLGSCCGAGHYGTSPLALKGCEFCSIAVYCRSGSRASAAIQVLLNNGFQGKLYNAQGTIQWANAGYPLVTTTASVIPPCTILGGNYGSCIADEAPTEAPSSENTKNPARKVPKEETKDGLKYKRPEMVINSTLRGVGGKRRLVNAMPDEMD